MEIFTIFQSRPLLVVILSLCIFSLPALAEKGGNGHGHGNSSKHKHHDEEQSDNGGNADLTIDIRIDGNDRAVIQNYIAKDFRSHCPPGLAKKHNGCLPPGQAKKRYAVGQVLPSGVTWQHIPSALRAQLMPVPNGYQYVRIDRDVLLISEASHKVIDAITLLSAVGKNSR